MKQNRKGFTLIGLVFACLVLGAFAFMAMRLDAQTTTAYWTRPDTALKPKPVVYTCTFDQLTNLVVTLAKANAPAAMTEAEVVAIVEANAPDVPTEAEIIALIVANAPAGVPYTGASANVDLGTQSLQAGRVKAVSTLVIPQATTRPETPEEGTLYFDSASMYLLFYSGGMWYHSGSFAGDI